GITKWNDTDVGIVLREFCRKGCRPACQYLSVPATGTHGGVSGVAGAHGNLAGPVHRDRG
ncbi:MAG: hypothetical protein QF536_05465, partial [Arenicellales bacterium]|nr:hypothetical protein [Arenicellales bacterium]